MGRSKSKDLKPPTAGIGDLVHAGAKGAIGAIPVIGAPASEILAFVIGPPMAKRNIEWCERVAEAIEELRERDVDVEKLRDDPAFTDTVLQASRIAMCTHQKEKLEALRNAVFNSGLPLAPDEDLRQMFLAVIDRFSVCHIRMLQLFDDPKGYFTNRGLPCPQYVITSSLAGVLNQAFPELRSQKHLREQVWKELQSAGLVSGANLELNMSADGATQSQTTEIGKQFVRFIQEPQA